MDFCSHSRSICLFLETRRVSKDIVRGLAYAAGSQNSLRDSNKSNFDMTVNGYQFI